jgi:signaling intermediate in Toll pathway protein
MALTNIFQEMGCFISDVGNLRLPFFENPTENQALVRHPSVHEQEDGTIFAICATGTSSRDSLLSWIRSLETDGNPALAEIPVLFTSISPLGEVVPVSQCDTGEMAEHRNMKSRTESKDNS